MDLQCVFVTTSLHCPVVAACLLLQNMAESLSGSSMVWDDEIDPCLSFSSGSSSEEESESESESDDFGSLEVYSLDSSFMDLSSPEQTPAKKDFAAPQLKGLVYFRALSSFYSMH